MDRLVLRDVDAAGNSGVHCPALLRDLARELGVHVAPFAQPKVGDEVRPARVDEPAMRKLLAELRVEELPQREERQEIRPLVPEQEVRLVGRLLLRERPIARIGHRQCARDDQHFRDAAVVHAPRAPSVRRGDRPAGARARARARSGGARRRPRPAPAAAGSHRRSRAGPAARRTETPRRRRARALPSAGSPPRASSAGSRGRCISAVRA